MTMPGYQDSYKYPEWKNWEGRWELIHGRPFDMTPAPRPEHQLILGELHVALKEHFRNHCHVFLAPFDVFLDRELTYEEADTIVQPDLSVICDSASLTEKGFKGPPSLIVEVLSPSTAMKDFNEKFNVYEQAGVEEYWIVDTEHNLVHLHPLVNGKYSERNTYGPSDVLHSVLFADLKIDLNGVFTEIK